MSSSTNIFDNLSSLNAPAPVELCDELDRYLSADPEHVTDVLLWWYEKRSVYPRLHRMALDYLLIPGKQLLRCMCNMSLLTQIHLATSIDVERTFSQGRLLLSHVRSRLSVQSTQALICLGGWSLRGYIKDKDVKAVTVLPEVPAGDAEETLAPDWDALN